ncbi:RNA polymerase sigma-70 factor, ECF subfamily [bacterium A37T11]|nr:RNA polymerase sigma-70 factor, ECF subfamily [bacterium A37T11]
MLYFIQKTAKSRELSEDVVQDFQKIWENRDHLDPQQPFKPYLYTIARHNLLNLLGRASRETRIMDEIRRSVVLDENSTELLLDFKESSALYAEALDQLPERCRAVFEKCQVEGLTHQQAAIELGISESTINNQMVKAWDIIRKYMRTRNGLLLLMAALFFS